jgi:prevent-host-death family protein
MKHACISGQKLEKLGFFIYYGGMSESYNSATCRVTASAFLKQYGLYSEKAQREPVTITSHGRDSLVLLSAEEFTRLKALDSRKPVHPWELSPEWQDALNAAEAPSWAARYNNELTAS